jgi:hypothetical protein
MSEQLFWLVWCPTGPTPPKYQHWDAGSAMAEAERLARACPGQKFYVLEAQHLRTVDAMQRVRLSDEPQIPF